MTSYCALLPPLLPKTQDLCDWDWLMPGRQEQMELEVGPACFE
jgi:hypothetical protein